MSFRGFLFLWLFSVFSYPLAHVKMVLFNGFFAIFVAEDRIGECSVAVSVCFFLPLIIVIYEVFLKFCS